VLWYSHPDFENQQLLQNEKLENVELKFDLWHNAHTNGLQKLENVELKFDLWHNAHTKGNWK
jgi:hydroxypyruvate isomerase